MDRELQELAKVLGEVALEKNALLATAESCTAGGISFTITDIAGSRFVTYSNESKMALLGVNEQTLKVHGAVSEECASEMVLGAIKHSNANLAVAVTGIAGPGGAVPGKPVGTVYLAWCERGSAPTVVREVFDGDRQAVRKATIRRALLGLLKYLQNA